MQQLLIQTGNIVDYPRMGLQWLCGQALNYEVMTLPDCLVDVEATVEDNFGQLDTQHALVLQLCFCRSNRNYVH